MSIGKNHRSNLPSDLLMMAKEGHEAANPPAVVFQNTLGHGNATSRQYPISGSLKDRLKGAVTGCSRPQGWLASVPQRPEEAPIASTGSRPIL
jgi:hypothetical protein